MNNNIIRVIIFLIILYIFDFIVLANVIIISLLLSEVIIKMIELTRKSEKR